MLSASDISHAIKTVPDLSANHKSKWDLVYPVVAEAFELDEQQTYLTYINKPGNTQVRLTKQIAGSWDKRLAVGVCGDPNTESASYPNQTEQLFRSHRKVECVVLLFENGSSGGWAARLIYGRPGSSIAQHAKSFWPDATFIEFGTPALGTADRADDSSEDATRVARALLRHGNVIIEGVPGTGKSYLINAIASTWPETTGRSLAPPTVTVLHPNTAYEDFVEGLRPVGTGGEHESDFTDYPSPDSVEPIFAPALGLFARTALQAQAAPDIDHLLVLDEINRANVPKVFGDLLLVLEYDKRATFNGDTWETRPDGEAVLHQSGVRFWVPDNLYVLGTMNTSDRSVSHLDSALRRRFVFVRLEPLDPVALNERLKQALGSVPPELEGAIDAWADLNLSFLRPELGPDSMLGHSYLFELGRSLIDSNRGEETAVVSEWLRIVLLPQLIDTLSSSGLAIINPGDGEQSSGLARFQSYLLAHGMQLAFVGTGLSRRLIVENVPDQESSLDDAAARSNTPQSTL